MSKEQWIWQCDRAIPSDVVVGRRVLEEVLEQLGARQWRRRDVFSVHLAMEEALVNAIVHGNRLDPEKQVRVSCRLSPEVVRIKITDQGEGFDVDAVPDPTDPDRLEAPSGRGVLLIRSFMSRVEYNLRGNSVVMEKERGKEA